MHGFLKRWLISGLGKEMHKIISGIVKDQKVKTLQSPMRSGQKFYESKWKVQTSTSLLGKMMFLLLNTLFMFVIAFLPRNKRPLISWLQALSTVDLEAKMKKICHCFYLISFYLPWRMRLDPMISIFSYWILSWPNVSKC